MAEVHSMGVYFSQIFTNLFEICTNQPNFRRCCTNLYKFVTKAPHKVYFGPNNYIKIVTKNVRK